jgi:hypothetical protein
MIMLLTTGPKASRTHAVILLDVLIVHTKMCDLDLRNRLFTQRVIIVKTIYNNP